MKEIWIETKRIGAALQVIAIDPESGTEVSFQAPASAGKAGLQRLASTKLDYVMRKKRNEI